MSIEIRFYDHGDTQATVWTDGHRDEDASILAHGWDYEAGDVVVIDGADRVLASVGSDVRTDDARGNYVVGEVCA